MQFETKQVPCLQPLKQQMQSAEETAEIRLPDGMPEIGTVLGAWGQAIVRSKEWNGGNMGLSCGVMAWVLYLPEDGEGVYSVQTWIPVQLRWDLPPADRDGVMLTGCAIRQLDARSTTSRKLMVRAVVDAVAEAWLPGQIQLPVAEYYPADVQVLTDRYPVMLPKEAGEKAFALEETVRLPNAVPKPEKIMYYRLQPELTDWKVMAGKAVFRGVGILHLVYRTEDGMVCSWDGEIPFSQYMDLEGSFEPDAQIRVQVSVTSLDLELDMEGNLQLKAGLLAQFMLMEQEMIAVSKDAYSPDRKVVPVFADIYLPTVLDSSMHTLRAEESLPDEASQVVDVAFYPACGSWEHGNDSAQMHLPGFFRVLCYDQEHRLCSRTVSWQGHWNLPADPSARITGWISQSGNPQAVSGMGKIDLRADVLVDAAVYSGKDMTVMTGMELEEAQEKDPNRPSLILCRKGDRSLWEVAKSTGSTVSDIERINGLQGEPGEEKLLLIPIR